MPLKLWDLLQETRDFRDLNSYKILFCTLVRSISEHASIVWSPNYIVHITNPERVKHKFIKLVNRMNKSYTEVQSVLGLQSLVDRRLVLTLFLCLKLLISLPIVYVFWKE